MKDWQFAMLACWIFLAPNLWPWMRLFFGVALLLLAIYLMQGCSDRPSVPIKPTRDDRTFEVSVLLTTPERAAEICAGYGVNEGFPASVERGCTRFFPDEKRCEIVAPTPTHVDDSRTTILGHELLHCVAGRYH
jgi:hypothetical protein